MAVRCQGGQMAHRIFLVEDHPVLRHSHAQVIQHTPGLEFCGEAGSGEEALEKIPASAPDLVLVDLSLPGMSGLDLIRQLEKERPELPLLIVSGHEMSLYQDDLKSMGTNVKAYVMKHQGPVFLLAEIMRVLG
jgi:DNA-binding NarL/FixJ family response regulator